ncbi:hydroxyethylthiazole kinase [Mumia flava]|uniref:Hydroxyethylthiazole kinase n=1 Tax=Mumia flava TaxID=1348852 RepID=A0A0B2BPG2_9ACTN|nr:hydroxyethylthiazole kinase [Mumia flava]PJJ54080.1 hydroxyethylthiazole kinase [Mumia flava]
MLEPSTVAHVHTRLRETSPLVQVITNYVSMDIAANLLNAAGASPAMVHDAHESGEFARIAGAVVANIGTLSDPWVDGMLAAVAQAEADGTPWILDPVAVGATTFRRDTVDRLLEHNPAVIRGNASEILAIATSAGAGRGVDADAAVEDVRSDAEALASKLGTVVAMTGATDLVTDGTRSVTITGGDPRAPMITALGCSASALVAACCAVHDDALEASASALAILSAAVEKAGEKAEGPGSLRWRLLDALSTLSADEAAAVAAR